MARMAARRHHRLARGMADRARRAEVGQREGRRMPGNPAEITGSFFARTGSLGFGNDPGGRRELYGTQKNRASQTTESFFCRRGVSAFADTLGEHPRSTGRGLGLGSRSHDRAPATGAGIRRTIRRTQTRRRRSGFSRPGTIRLAAALGSRRRQTHTRCRTLAQKNPVRPGGRVSGYQCRAG